MEEYIGLIVCLIVFHVVGVFVANVAYFYIRILEYKLKKPLEEAACENHLNSNKERKTEKELRDTIPMELHKEAYKLSFHRQKKENEMIIEKLERGELEVATLNDQARRLKGIIKDLEVVKD